MEIRAFKPDDLPDLHNLLVTNRWEYFLDPVIDEHGLKTRDEKYFSSKSTQTLVALEENQIIGYIQFDNIEDASDTAPSFTLCVATIARGKGVGTALLKKGSAYIFNTVKNIRRIYATTRADNVAMIKTFEAVGFRKEARHLKEWENRDTKEFVDAVGYAILREEFKMN